MEVSASLVLGDTETTTRTKLTQTEKLQLVCASLTEIPFSILQFLTDGKSPKERPTSNPWQDFFVRFVNFTCSSLIF